MKALIKREFWEHRGAFVKTPIITGIVLLVISVIAYVTALVLSNKTGANDFANKILQESSNLNPDHLVMAWDGQMMGISSLYLTILFFVLFFFILGSLFDDRKDGSILFWKSLPISDTETVISKMLTAMIFVPLLFVAVFLVLALIFMVLLTVLALIHGLNPIELIWTPASLFGAAKVALVGVFVQMLWAMPIYGWLMFCSSFSKRRPFLFAVFVPLILSLSIYWINVLTFKFFDFEMFRKPLNYIGHAMFPYGSGSFSNGTFDMSNIEDGSTITMIVNNMLNSVSSVEILYGLIFSIVMVTVSIWVRRYRNTA
jgi:ABC-2 type transport system permease protein